MDAVVVKVGGSLALKPEKLRDLCMKLSQLSHQQGLIVVPGGGEFADIVRDMDKRFKLAPSTNHRMAILGMDEYGMLLHDLSPNSECVDDFGLLKDTLKMGRLPIFLPSAFTFADDGLENSWDVTSDSIAAYVAERLGVRQVVLVTDVDGVFDCDPKKHPEAKLLMHVTAEKLLGMGRTSVDKYLPKLLLQLKVECIVVNGFYPERVEAVLQRKKTVCTIIEGGF